MKSLSKGIFYSQMHFYLIKRQFLCFPCNFEYLTLELKWLLEILLYIWKQIFGPKVVDVRLVCFTLIFMPFLIFSTLIIIWFVCQLTSESKLRFSAFSGHIVLCIFKGPDWEIKVINNLRKLYQIQLNLIKLFQNWNVQIDFATSPTPGSIPGKSISLSLFYSR